MKKSLIFIIVLMGLLACGQSYEEQQRLSRAEKQRLHTEDSLALKVAVMPTLDCLPVWLAKEHNLFDTTKVDVRLRRFNAQMDIDTALTNDRVEGGFSDLVRVERMKRRGVPLDYLSATGAYWLLIANRTARVKEVKQLGDKMLAMTRYSATDYLTDKALEGVKTTAKVYKVQINDVYIRLHMLLNNEMDAEWLTEPQATAALNAGNEVLKDSRKMNVNLGAIVFRSDAMKDKRRQQQLSEFVKGYNRACDSINLHGIPHYAKIITQYSNADKKVIGALPKMKYEHVALPKLSDINKAKAYIK
jgi:NitT/TauT family transport system substrate-binding protein